MYGNPSMTSLGPVFTGLFLGYKCWVKLECKSTSLDALEKYTEIKVTCINLH